VVTDLDLAVAGDPAESARAIAAECGGHAFELSAEFETWRAVASDQAWQVDLTPLRGNTIEADLGARDFTLGAIAVPLSGGEPVDPFGGLADLDRRLLRAVGPESFASDPLRLLRAARLATELELEIDPETISLARAESRRAAEPAGERQLAELRRLLDASDPLRGLRLLDELALTRVVLPEVEALRGVEQGPNHHLDVHGHTLAVLERTLAVEGDLDRFGGDRAAEVGDLLAEPLADDMTRGTALRFGALLHDIGKPQTRGERGSYVTFIGHDRLGAEMVAGICERLRTSRTLSRHLQALTLHHLRLGFLVHEAPLPPRRVHEYLRATEPASVDVTLLTIADRLSARGSGPFATEEAVEAHLALAREMLAAALDWRREGPPEPFVRGDELAAALGIEEGPELGELLAELEAAQYAGEVKSREAAIERARQARG
jgi:putative nucleotidyltransferase with HDIG domain